MLEKNSHSFPLSVSIPNFRQGVRTVVTIGRPHGHEIQDYLLHHAKHHHKKKSAQDCPYLRSCKVTLEYRLAILPRVANQLPFGEEQESVVNCCALEKLVHVGAQSVATTLVVPGRSTMGAQRTAPQVHARQHSHTKTSKVRH